MIYTITKGRLYPFKPGGLWLKTWTIPKKSSAKSHGLHHHFRRCPTHKSIFILCSDTFTSNGWHACMMFQKISPCCWFRSHYPISMYPEVNPSWHGHKNLTTFPLSPGSRRILFTCHKGNINRGSLNWSALLFEANPIGQLQRFQPELNLVMGRRLEYPTFKGLGQQHMGLKVKLRGIYGGDWTNNIQQSRDLYIGNIMRIS